jgi:general secretion pathway protein A
MYTAFFGFREKPFNIVPDPSFLYLTQKHRMALTHLEYGLMDRIGFIILTGEIGAGKTTIVKHFLNQIDPDTEVALIFNTNVSGDQLLQLILSEFRVSPQGENKPAHLDAFNRFLIEKYSAGKKALLIVDEAQNLDEEGLEEIRMLSNLQTDKEALLQILLVGQPALREKLEKPSLAQLSQRVGVSYHIAPLSLEETREYIAHRLEKVGASDTEIFTPKAVARIFEHSGGIPRTINILCDGSLLYGYADELKTIDEPIVEKLVKDKRASGVFSPPSMKNDMSAEDGPSPDDEGLARRMGSLEAQVNKLLGGLDRLAKIQTGEILTENQALTRRLETRLTEERGRAERLSAECEDLRGRLNSATVSSRGQEPPTDEKHPTGRTAEPVEMAGECPPRKPLTQRAIHRLTKWFAG